MVKKLKQNNRLFPSCFEPHYDSEAKCKVIIMKISFHSYANKTNFHMKSFALSLAFIMRFTATRKWPIQSWSRTREGQHRVPASPGARATDLEFSCSVFAFFLADFRAKARLLAVYRKLGLHCIYLHKLTTHTQVDLSN